MHIQASRPIQQHMGVTSQAVEIASNRVFKNVPFIIFDLEYL